ncbi:MAG: glycosyltransferase family 4 protein [Acidobacteriota bacterium]|nr:glycosyltransferase family 4 protein [Acidobacteriota bacterium]
MNVHQFATSLVSGDAISDEMLEIRDILRSNGYTSEIFTHGYEPATARYVRDYREYKAISSPDNVLLFHFSIGSPVSKMAFRVPDRKIMIYHNITPHEFFLDNNRVLARECYRGRLQLGLFKDKVALALGDSDFNRRELEAAGYAPTGVLPILMNFGKFDGRADPVVTRLLAEPKTTILFVGRVIPNKRPEDVLKVFHIYQKAFNPESRLILAGDYRGQDRSLAALQDYVDRHGLKDVHLTGHTTFPELLAYYRAADVYLSMSEHEGFGVPLLEAFYQKIPVIALAAGAVEETMNGGGILLRRKDIAGTAALIDRLATDPALRERIVAGQLEALKKYARPNVARVLLDHVARVRQA